MTFRHLACLFAALTPVLAAGQSGSVSQVGQPRARANHQVMSGALPTQPPSPPLKIFGTAVSYDTASVDAGPIAAADVNKDGKLDVVLGNCCAGSTVGVMLGNGDGTP